MRIPIDSSTSYRGRNSRANLPALTAFLALTLTAWLFLVVCSPAVSTATAVWFKGLSRPQGLPRLEIALGISAFSDILMGLAGWLVWRERYHSGRGVAILAFGLQLLLNAAWAPVLFRVHSLGGALFTSIAGVVGLVWTLREFARVRPAAAATLLPCLIWAALVTFAGFRLWKLNL